MATYQGWAQAILNALGAPVTSSNLKFLAAWQQAEGGSAAFNPLNTTQPASGATNYNSVGVRNYGSAGQGTKATVDTLLNGHYNQIVQMLRAGNISPSHLAQAVANSPWGTGTGVQRVLGSGTVKLPSSNTLPTNGNDKPAPTSIGNLRQLAALMMMNNAANTVQGNVGGNPGALLQLATLRNQLGQAEQSFGSSPSKSPTVHGGWAGKSLDGSTQMVVGGKSPYSNLKFASHADWQHINPRLLRSINSLAAQHGMVVDIISGYRSNDYSSRVGGFKGDPHTKGLAVDAYINGRPIGDVFGANVWKQFNIRSGNVPGFYNGKPDPEHLDLIN